jgi:hypothetical protein
LIVVEPLQFWARNPDVVAALFGVVQVMGPLDRGFIGTAFVIGEESGMIVGVGLPV